MSAASPLRVLPSKEDEHWVAQCLEYDIGAQARDLGELRKRLLIAIRADENLRRHRKPFAALKAGSSNRPNRERSTKS